MRHDSLILRAMIPMCCPKGRGGIKSALVTLLTTSYRQSDHEVVNFDETQKHVRQSRMLFGCLR